MRSLRRESKELMFAFVLITGAFLYLLVSLMPRPEPKDITPHTIRQKHAAEVGECYATFQKKPEYQTEAIRSAQLLLVYEVNAVEHFQYKVFRWFSNDRGSVIRTQIKSFDESIRLMKKVDCSYKQGLPSRE